MPVPFPMSTTSAATAAAAGGGTGGSHPHYSHPPTSSTSKTAVGAVGGDDSTTTTNMIQLINFQWNPIMACKDLQKSCQILTERCLKVSAKWAAEQWMGLPSEIIAAASHDTTTPSTISDDLEWNAQNQNNKHNPGLYYARSLLELGEYAHAAAVLSQRSLNSKASSVDQGMSPPIADLTPVGIYLRAYALYLAGEKAKEEEQLIVNHGGSSNTSTNANSGTTSNNAGDANDGSGANMNPTHLMNQNAQAKNPYLQQLSYELLDAYEKDQLDAFGLYVYGIVLKAAATASGGNANHHHYPRMVLPPQSPSAHGVLIQSILAFPYNWSAWLDLADLVVSSSSSNNIYNNDDDTEDQDEDDVNDPRRQHHHHQQQQHQRFVELQIEEHIQPELGGHFMYHFFCAHLRQERQAHADALMIYEKWMDANLFQGSPYLLLQFAVCSYHTRQYAAAKTLLEDLHNHMPYRLDSMDVYSNILYVQEDAVALSQLAHTAVLVDKYRAETCVIVGNYYSLKQQRAKAILYFQRALKMDPSFTSAWTLMGHEYVEWKQTANAMQAYRRSVQIAPQDYRAWYGLGQTYELLNMNLYALYYYKQAAQLRPFDARMWCAVGTSYTHLHRYFDAIRAYERALQLDEAEGVATQKLAALYRDQTGCEEKAAACYMRHLEIRYLVTSNNNNTNDDNSSNNNNVAGMETNGSESLEKMLQAIFVESTEAEAILYLAHYHRKKRDYDIAAVFCSRLLDYPGPEKEDAKAMLRELRSRSKPGGSGMSGSRPGGGGGSSSHSPHPSSVHRRKVRVKREADSFEFSP